MEKEEIGLIIDEQRKFFASGKTFEIKYRLEILKKLRALIIQHEQEIVEALWKDFHKPELEVIGSESRLIIKGLNYIIRNLREWGRNKRVTTPLLHFMAHSYVVSQPYGQVLVLSPWNFPFQLAFMPLVGALAAGNCVILKVSRQVPCIAAVMEKILSYMPKELVAIVDGDHDISEYLLNQKFDYIFFTGSQRVGKYVMQKAAENLTPFSLELGGKNPCVVAADARLDYAAKRIAWGKLFNCGQSCVAPDYLLIDKKVKDQFLELISKEIKMFYGDNPETSNDFARVISSESADRISRMINVSRIVTGGIIHSEVKYIAPTVIKDVKPDDPIMKEEVFGPVLPVIDYEEFDEVYAIIKKHPKPLSAYIFTRDKKLVRDFLMKTQSGNACVNETMMQFASHHLPYGGIGSSGIGRYHGKSSFETFSNIRPVLVKSNLLDVPVRYPPYSKLKTKIISLLMR
jgi:aldehyde dehydrogenase (NAD+)